MSNAPKNLLTIAVPLRWRAPFRQAFRAEPFERGILLPLSDWLAEHDKPTDSLCCRAAYARGWLPAEMPAAHGWKNSWDWRKLTGRPRYALNAVCWARWWRAKEQINDLALLPSSVFDTLLRGVRQEGPDVVFMEFPSAVAAMASLLCALRPVPARQLAEWCRAGGLQQ